MVGFPALWAGTLAALVAAGSFLWALRAPLFLDNLHTVEPGIYRAAQPSPRELEALADALGLRSVLSVRGGSAHNPWFAAQKRVLEARGIEFFALRLAPDKWPARAALLELVRILDKAPRPILLHCVHGVERTGLASAIALLLDSEAGVERALGQFRLQYGFSSLSSSQKPLEVVRSYVQWLEAEQGGAHSPELFRHWVRRVYVAGIYSARIEPLELPRTLVSGPPTSTRFRVTNTSARPWPMGRGSGLVALGYRIQGIEPPGFALEFRAWLARREIAPGESFVIEAELPGDLPPGRYGLMVDLVNEAEAWFEGRGSEALHLELEVRAALAREPISGLDPNT